MGDHVFGKAAARVALACAWFVVAAAAASAEHAVSPVAQPGYLLPDPYHGDRPMLDFSYAGYALVPESIEPDDTLPVVRVGDHGATPDDKASDRDGIAAAIAAAEAMGGAVVQFDAGVYDINPEPGQHDGIVITGDRIVLRGVRRAAGSDRETVLFMEHHLEPRDPNKMWSTPSMFEFRLDSQRNKRPRLAGVTSTTRRGGFTVTVDDASRLEQGAMVILRMQSPAANEARMAGLEPWDIWTGTIQRGTEVRETHRIAKIDGREVTFAEPIHADIDPAHGWSLRAAPLAEGWVIEDITFRGDAPDPFVHHKNAAHDGGWSMVSMTRGYAPVVRRCRFIDVSRAVGFGATYGATAIDNTIEGRQGHNAIDAGFFSYGTLIAFCDDLVEKGTFHGFGSSKGASGTVVYRCKNSNRGFDWHASGPYATLIDACTGGLIGNGGNYTVLPNHLEDLVFWNFEQTAGVVYEDYQWWEPQCASERYSGAKVVMPIIVGFHGPAASTFDESQCLLIESHGRPVEPESLFEAQLERRLGALPAWVTQRVGRSTGSLGGLVR